MDAIKQWAFAVCAAMVACGLAQMILPKSGMEKMFRMVVSIFFLCCLLSPLILRLPDLLVEVELGVDSDALTQAERLSEAVDAQTTAVIEQSLLKLVRENLAESGINAYALTINIETKGQSEAELRSVLIQVDEAQRDGEADLVRRLEDLLGLEVELDYR